MLFKEGRCFIIAEVAQAHDGSLGTAHAYIDAVARAGADAVKFQTHIAAAESTPNEPWRVRFSPQDETRYGYWKRMEFTAQQWAGLRDHAHSSNLTFLSSPFSLDAVAMLESLDVPAWKVGAGELTNLPMLRPSPPPASLFYFRADWRAGPTSTAPLNSCEPREPKPSRCSAPPSILARPRSSD